MAGSNLFIPLALVLLPLLILIFILKHFKTSSSKSLPLPPGPNPWPLVGNLFHMGKMPHVTLSNFAKTYGPLISLKLGTQIMVVASSPAAATEILKTHDRVLSARYVPQVMPLKRSELNNISLGWSLECGEGWKYLRTICRTELFSSKAIESQACLREEKVMEMVKFIDGKEGKVVNIGEITFTCVYNTLSNLLLSKNIFSFENDGCEGKELKALVRTIMEIAMSPNISDFYPILSGLDLQGIKRKGKELGEQINAYWTAIIRERKEAKENSSSRDGRDFLDALIENNFSDVRTNSLLQELFTAGTDTTSSTIEWAMAELIKNPESMKKVEHELEREIKQDVVKESQLPQLTYLQACVKETLRLHPPVPLLVPHRANESCQVMNYSVPKDSQVLVNVWAIARDPLYWEDPLTFKPERFLSSTLEFKGADFEFLPFGAGRRICPGLPMAIKQVPYVLASLIHFFNWSLPHGEDPKTLDMSEKFGIALQKDKPLLLVSSPRVGK
ncbi:probable (S)-N-methylcoclaurine 3'-hydroxylase isozyme 2 [Tripterygium wilfordii]|uniref:probable (S)-N-methylcoclaurine 3'-hydroxylase isozyme 2 n=1 Tax=Tripterygium wilfordii TaxID=458696 RepID=UPI0018F8165B|nr:probable (S)-N-methylcoclaurine 3'-hydroxylase isozyme 2 [Tripterygium wilfordii]